MKTNYEMWMFIKKWYNELKNGSHDPKCMGHMNWKTRCNSDSKLASTEENQADEVEEDEAFKLFEVKVLIFHSF